MPNFHNKGEVVGKRIAAGGSFCGGNVDLSGIFKVAPSLDTNVLFDSTRTVVNDHRTRCSKILNYGITNEVLA